MLGPLFDKVAKVLKRDPKQRFSCENGQFFKNTYFEEHLGMAAPRCKGKISFASVLLVEVNVAGKNTT